MKEKIINNITNIFDNASEKEINVFHLKHVKQEPIFMKMINILDQDGVLQETLDKKSKEIEDIKIFIKKDIEDEYERGVEDIENIFNNKRAMLKESYLDQLKDSFFKIY